MNPDELCARAAREAHELGDPPDDPTDRAGWVEERQGAVQLLAALADHDAELLQRAAGLVAVNDTPLARDLLLEAASSS